MSFEVKAISVPSTDGIHNLQGKIYIPSDEIKGLFHIVHGMTEHIERYDHIMSYLSENGYVCFGYDNLGHGKTAINDGELGFIAEKDGWKYLVDDVNAFDIEVKKQYPDKELYLMGHSMGSFIARLAFAKFPANYKKLIACGSTGKNPLSALGLILTSVIGAIRGRHHISKFILKLAFGSYNKKFSGNTGYEWLTNDISLIEKYSKDKFCTFKFSVSAMHDLIKLISVCNSNLWFKSVDKTKPIFLISGEDDPVGNYGKGIKEVYNKLLKNEALAKIKLYKNCRHEIINDICRDEVLFDILNFVKQIT